MLSLLRKPLLRRRRLVTAALSIMLSTMLFFCVVSTLEYIDQSSEAYLGGESIFVLTERGASTFRDTFLSLELAESLKKLEGINTVSPESFYYETVEGEPVIIRAVTPVFFQLEPLSVTGRVLTDADLHTAVIGREIAERFNLTIDDTFIVPDPIHASYIEYTVVGIFSQKGFLDSEIIIPLESGWTLAHYPRIGKVSIIRMEVDPGVWPDYNGLYTLLKEPPTIEGVEARPEGIKTAVSGTVRDNIGIHNVEVYFFRDKWKKKPADVAHDSFTVTIPQDTTEYYLTAVDLFGNITSTTVHKVTPLEATDVVYSITPESPTEEDDIIIHCFSDADNLHLYYTLEGPWSEVEMEKKDEEFVYRLGTVKGDLLFYFLLEKNGIEYETTVHKCTVKKPEEKGFIQKIFQGESTITSTELLFPKGITSNFDIHSSVEFSEQVKEVGLGKLYTLTLVILLVTIMATVLAIFSSVTASVFESRREIGILLSLGSKKRILYTIFLVNSFVISLAAGVLGSLGGYVLLLLFHKYGAIVAGTVLIQPVFTVHIVLYSVAFAIILGLSATYVSVRTISSLDPSEALKRVYIFKEAAAHMKEINLPDFPVKKSGVALLLIFVFSALLHVYPTVLTGLPFDPDSWSHYSLSEKTVETGHFPQESPFFFVDYNTTWPGLTAVLTECSILSGIDLLTAARFCIPLISACSIILLYVIVKYVSQSSSAGVVSAAILTAGGLYVNRSASLTKESLAFTLLLLCLYLYFTGRTQKRFTMMSLSFAAYFGLAVTHHISALMYMLIVFSVSVPLTMYELYHGTYSKRMGVCDSVYLGYITFVFYYINMRTPLDYLQIGMSDIALLLSYLLIFGCIITYLVLKQNPKKLVYISILSAGLLAVLPYFIVYVGVYPFAPEAFLKEAPPYMVLLIIGIISLYVVLTFPPERRLILSGWLIGLMSFLLFALTRERSAFSFVLLYRTLSYGYQLLSVFCGIAIVFAVQRLRVVSKYLVIPFMVFVMILSFYAVQSGYLGSYYEQKDLYWMPEYSSGLWVRDHLIPNGLLTDERLGKMFQGVADTDYDLGAFSELMVKGVHSPGVVVVYQDMYSHGFVVDVNFVKPEESLDEFDCIYSTTKVKIYDYS